MSKNKVQITKEFSCEHRMLTVDSLVRNQVSYDFNPPYQRNKVWTIEAKRCLIETIISNNTINAMHICIKDEDVESYYVIDGKQRFTTIIDFANGDFPITFESLKNKRYPYIKQEAEKGNADAKLFVRRFEDFQLYVIRYQKKLSLSEQVEAFKRINYAANLKPNEKIFGQSYYVKSLCNYILSQGLVSNNLFKRMKGVLSDNNRFEWTRLLYEMLVTIAGPSLTEGFATIDLTENKIPIYLETTTKTIVDAVGGVDVPIFSEDELVKIGINEKLKTLKKCLQYIEKLILENDACQDSYKSVITSYSKPYILHFVLFLYDGYDRKIFTDSFLDFHHSAMLKIWQTWCNKEFRELYKIRDASKDRTGVEVKLAYLQELLVYFGLDTGRKGRPVSPIIKEQVKLYVSSHKGLRDKEVGELISLQNMVVDHIDPKSISSKTDFELRSKYGNLAKSNSVQQGDKINAEV